MFELSFEGPVARLRLDRPAQRNAIAVEGWTRLSAACAEVEASSARLLILSGSAEAFSAGADLREFAALARDPEAVASFRTAMREGMDALAALPIATIALVEGACFGAAVALAMACDVRAASPGARFAITPAKLGISYPQQDIARLVALVGPGEAARLLFSGEAIDGAEAARIGLVEIVSDEPFAAVGALTQAILASSSESVALLKRAIRTAGYGISSDQGLDRDFDARFGSEDFARRLAALRSGR